jgi:hypothetical protein
VSRIWPLAATALTSQQTANRATCRMTWAPGIFGAYATARFIWRNAACTRDSRTSGSSGLIM